MFNAQSAGERILKHLAKLWARVEYPAFWLTGYFKTVMKLTDSDGASASIICCINWSKLSTSLRPLYFFDAVFVDQKNCTLQHQWVIITNHHCYGAQLCCRALCYYKTAIAAFCSLTCWLLVHLIPEDWGKSPDDSISLTAVGGSRMY